MKIEIEYISLQLYYASITIFNLKIIMKLHDFQKLK